MLWVSTTRPGQLMGLYPLEGEPTEDQKVRLDMWLRELRDLCRRHRILVESDTNLEDVRLIDLDRMRIIGVGLTPQLAVRAGRWRITHFDSSDSVLDGVWLVDTADGPRPQMDL